MERFVNLDDYKKIVLSVKQIIGHVKSNNYYSLRNLQDLIDSGRLFYDVFEDGIFLYSDEENYYQVSYIWKKDKKICIDRELCLSDKPLLINEMDKFDRKKDYIHCIEKDIERIGFVFLKENKQIELSPIDCEDFFQKFIDEGLEKCKDIHLETIDTNKDMDEIVELWLNGLDATDIPYDHTSLSKNDKIILARNEKNEIVSTEWYRELNGVSEGRHLVTREDYKGKGLGKTLTAFWCKESEKDNCKKCIGWTATGNFTSIALHKKLGFFNNGISCRQYLLKNR